MTRRSFRASIAWVTGLVIVAGMLQGCSSRQDARAYFVPGYVPDGLILREARLDKTASGPDEDIEHFSTSRFGDPDGREMVIQSVKFRSADHGPLYRAVPGSERTIGRRSVSEVEALRGCDVILRWDETQTVEAMVSVCGIDENEFEQVVARLEVTDFAGWKRYADRNNLAIARSSG